MDPTPSSLSYVLTHPPQQALPISHPVPSFHLSICLRNVIQSWRKIGHLFNCSVIHFYLSHCLSLRETKGKGYVFFKIGILAEFQVKMVPSTLNSTKGKSVFIYSLVNMYFLRCIHFSICCWLSVETKASRSARSPFRSHVPLRSFNLLQISKKLSYIPTFKAVKNHPFYVHKLTKPPHDSKCFV